MQHSIHQGRLDRWKGLGWTCGLCQPVKAAGKGKWPRREVVEPGVEFTGSGVRLLECKRWLFY